MERLLHFALFFSLLSLVLGGAQFYVFHRIVYYFTVNSGLRMALATWFTLTWLVMSCALPLLRLVSREMAVPFVWLGFGWMGVLMFLVLGFVIADTLLIGHYLATRSQDVDMERRSFFKQILGVSVLGVTGAMGVVGVRNILRDVVVKPVTITLKKLPQALSGVTIAQLSDVHIGPILEKDWLRGVVEMTNALGADIIVITGDMVDGTVEELKHHVASLADLRAPHGVYFITGNHEFYSGAKEWRAHITSLGIRVLSNEGVEITPRAGADTLYLAGVEDYHASQFGEMKQDIALAMAARKPEQVAILLAHQPVAIHEAVTYDVDVQLSGHTHGGQIFPFNFAVYVQQPYVKGLHTYPNSDTQIYVSSGTGFWGPPMRVGTSSEVALITLRSVAS